MSKYDKNDPLAKQRADMKWNLLAVSQGPSIGLIADGSPVWDKPSDFHSNKEQWPASSKESQGTCQLPVGTGAERPHSGKEIWLTPDGIKVSACTRGCHYSYRNGICLHGVPFTDRCTDNCKECRVPYRVRRKKGEFVGDCLTGQKYDASQCVPPYKLVSWSERVEWETKLANAEWSGSEKHGLNQSEGHLDHASPKAVTNVKQLSSNKDSFTAAVESDNGGLIASYGVSFLKARLVQREVPEHFNNDAFIAEFLKWLYPKDSIQQAQKRKNMNTLIFQYFRLMYDSKTIQENLKLTVNGLESKVARLKEKAIEFLDETHKLQKAA